MHGRATPTSHLTPSCLLRHNGRRFPTRRAGSVKSLSGDGSRSPQEDEESPESAILHPIQFYCYCCTAGCGLCAVCCRWRLVGSYCFTAVIVLWWGGRWVGVGRWVLDGGASLAAQGGSPRWLGFVKKTNFPPFLITSYRLENQPNAPRVPVYCRTGCCTAVLL